MLPASERHFSVFSLLFSPLIPDSVGAATVLNQAFGMGLLMQFANVFRTKSVYPHSICPELLFKRVSNGLGVPCVCVCVCSKFRMVPEPSQPKVTPNLHPPGAASSSGRYTCCVHTAGVRLAWACDCLCMHAVLQKVGTAQCFCKLTVCFPEVQAVCACLRVGIFFLLSGNKLDDIAQLVFFHSLFLLLGKSMCPGCTVSSPYLRLFVPTLQLPSGLCENTRIFQRHGN